MQIEEEKEEGREEEEKEAKGIQKADLFRMRNASSMTSMMNMTPMKTTSRRRWTASRLGDASRQLWTREIGQRRSATEMKTGNAKGDP